MKRLVLHLRIRPRLSLSVALGLGTALLAPGPLSAVTRGLLGWNVAAWLYLVLVSWMMLRGDHVLLRRVAVAQAEGAATVLALVVAAALASLVGVVAELSAAKVPGAPHAVPHVAFALATVLGAWLLVPTVFTLTYASVFYRHPDGHGLLFASGGLPADAPYRPDYWDFLYFAFTIAVASQTSDVAVTAPAMRRLVLLQSLLAFAFNTAILAFTVNIAASLL